MLIKRKSPRQRHNLKRFSKKRVDISKYVKDLYVDHGIAYISCNVQDYYDIIDRYSVEGYEWLNESFVRFVDENANYVPTEYPIILEICGHRFTRKQRECIEATIADYYALKMGDAQMALEKNTLRSAVLAALGALFAIPTWGVIQSGTRTTFSEAILVLFGFFIWEFLDCFWFARRPLVQAKIDASQVASLKVTFQEEFEDGPVEPDEEKKILKEIFEDTVLVPSDEW